MLRFLKSVKNYYQLYKCIADFYRNYKEIEEDLDIKLDNFVDRIIPLIKQCGCVCIKFAQWITPILDIMYVDKQVQPPWLLKLEKFYENCEDHSIEYTKELYLKEFNVNIDNKYEIIEIIGSGSIGQVYRIKDKRSNNEYAMKVLHPNVKEDIKIFKKILNLMMKFNHIRKMVHHIIPIDFMAFMESFELQMDMINEANNLCMFKFNNKQNSAVIKIPELIEFRKSILIMTYERGVNVCESKCSDYVKGKLILFFYLVMRDSFENKNFNHADVHKGNWKFSENYDKIVMYDFGYFYTVSNEYLIKNLSSAFLEIEPNMKSHDKLYNIATSVFQKDDDEIKEIFYSYMDNVDKKNITDPKTTFNISIHISRKLNKLIDPFIFQAIICQIQNIKLLSTYGVSNQYTKYETNDFIFKSNYIDYINICNTYDIFPELKKQLIDIVDEKQLGTDKLFDITIENKYINDEIKSLLKFD